MEVKAKLRYLRISPRKVRLVTNLIKGMGVKEAEAQLKFLSKRAAVPVLKLLKSAVSNAVHNFNLDPSNLFIFNIRVDPGPTLVRYIPRARGKADEIRKRSSHITIILKEKSEKGKKRLEVKEMPEESKEKVEKVKTKTIRQEEKEKKVVKKEKIKTPVIQKQKIFRRKAV